MRTWVIIALLATSNLLAVPITFTHSSTGSGTIGTTPFSNAAFTIVGVGDTDDIMTDSHGIYIDDSEAFITIEGLGAFKFTSGTRTFLNQAIPEVGFSAAGASGVDLLDGPSNSAFATWNMQTAIGPISGAGRLFNQSPALETSGGVLLFNAGPTTVTFRAAINGPKTPVLTTLWQFGAAPDGAFPESSVVFDNSGNLYGTTVNGGNSGMGTIYQLSPPAADGPWTEAVLYRFGGVPDGSTPEAPLLIGADGSMYTTTRTVHDYAEWRCIESGRGRESDAASFARSIVDRSGLVQL
jgi:uncharacterized repeat protein (TIGR03803 family)